MFFFPGSSGISGVTQLINEQKPGPSVDVSRLQRTWFGNVMEESQSSSSSSSSLLCVSLIYQWIYTNRSDKSPGSPGKREGLKLINSMLYKMQMCPLLIRAFNPAALLLSTPAPLSLLRFTPFSRILSVPSLLFFLFLNPLCFTPSVILTWRSSGLTFSPLPPPPAGPCAS